MPTLTCSRIADLLVPYTAHEAVTQELLQAIQVYLELILKWNARTSLTSIRNPEELVQRQVGESLFASYAVPDAGTLLDFGSGAGFPGIPLQLVRSRVLVTLAESQGKKASFLQEAVRTLGLNSTVWARRVEDLPAPQVFDVVIMRAVDASPLMVPIAAARVAPSGSLVRFTGESDDTALEGWGVTADLTIPLSRGRLVTWSRRAAEE